MNAAAKQIKFAPAVRENISLLVGLAGGTGSGKTYTGMCLAAGMAGAKRFAVIDTEARRALHYADQFQFDFIDLHPPFRPDTYAQAIVAADKAGYPVIMVDSMSHEWAGEGGILEWHEEELTRMAGEDWKRREACKMAAWIRPKMGHKKMVARLLQLRAHLVLCFRAEEKVDMVRDPGDGKMKIVPKASRAGLDGWLPICEKTLPFELTTSFLLLADAPGIPKPIKLEAQHRPFFALDKPVTPDSGARLAAWAAGGTGGPIDTIERLLSDYAQCASAAQLQALEARRAALWKGAKAPTKQRLKAASDAAGQRIKARPVITAGPVNWAQRLQRARTVDELNDEWESCCTAFDGDPPNDCDAVYQARREQLTES
ncbi:MAG: AAA family ATPase [Proteobacteria bacterium]|nr:AAA family ATPase [Pseudomonadota bacterium]